MNKKIILALFLTLAFVSNVTLVSAQSIIVNKISPKEIKLGEILNVIINIKNNYNVQENVTVTEQFGDAEAIEPMPVIPSIPEGMIAARPPFFEWSLILDGNSEKNIEYKIKPLTVGYYSFSPTVVQTANGQNFYSNTPSTIVKCIPNNACEVTKGENYFTCPEDCPSGSADGVCDMIRDGICDPDCTKESDLDCYCGDGICQKFENYKTCPKDCKQEIPNLIIYGIIVVAFISLIILLLFRTKKRKK